MPSSAILPPTIYYFEGITRAYGRHCWVNLNDHLMLRFSSRLHGRSSFPVTNSCPIPGGNVWDGRHFGFYSMLAAHTGNRVFAFAMSPRVLRVPERGCRLNGVAVTTVAHPVTTGPRTYIALIVSACTNRCLDGSGGQRSTTYLEAAARYGMPAFIKMHIEGGEREFLESVEFQDWIQGNRITLLVEMHRGYTLAADAFPAMARQQGDHDHLLLESLTGAGRGERRPSLKPER